ncbi:MAG: hypothetical protein PVH87_01225 [Desulfobacteraceae bacterium]
MKCLFHIGCVILLMVTVSVLPVGADISSGEIPQELARWRSWVLHGHETALCPTAYDNGAVVRCQWPSRLMVDVKDDGGRFEQRWLMFANGWVNLPGSPEMWPDGVVIDGNAAAVVNRDGHPSVRLTPGEHLIKGRFYWPRMPEMMRVPPSIGLLSLTVGGQHIGAPVIDAQGRLWLQEREVQSGRQDNLQVRIFRLINDTIPMRVTTLVRLNVSGQAREIHLEDVLIQNAVPMELNSRLPARIDADGQLLVQARPGRWDVRIVVRMPEAVKKIGPVQTPFGDEVWSFQPQHHLRMVEIEGAAQVEPGQTEMPDEWRRYSAYLVKSKSNLILKEIRRGDPDPVPDQLVLFRHWWLDFNGKGFTLQDVIHGTLSRQWSLAMDAPVALGRVAVDGKDQVITAQGDQDKAGVELRQGNLNLQSDARLPRRSGSIRAVGWDHDFQKVSGELHLPPGWRLMAAMGVDQVSDTWIQSWSLLDFFLVLIIALAVFKLRDWRWGLLALAAMVLLFQEPGAPRIVWLHILAVLAILPLLPDNWIKRVVSLWGVGAVVALLIISIPFMVHQVRWGFYPQLAPHNDYLAAAFERRQVVQTPQEEAPQKRRSKMLKEKARVRQLAEPAASPPPVPDRIGRIGKAVWHQDPDALIPTGPGLPEWHWHTIRLQWNGPVAKDQAMRLLLISPWMNLLLALLRVALLGLLVWGVIDWRPWWQKIQTHLNIGKTMTVALLLAAAHWAPVQAADQGSFPPPEMLETLKQRLLEPPDCLPFCADISRLEVAVSGDDLQVMLKVNAAVQTSIPLPVNRKSWTPEQILLDNAPISGLARDEGGGLWAVVPAGLHTVVMLGTVSQERIIQIPLPLKPHLASSVAKGWAVEGIMPNGTTGSSIQLTRTQDKRLHTISKRGNDILQPYLHVQRVLHLGLTWQVTTTLERVTPIGTPIVVSVPLMASESVTTAGLHVDRNHVLINMSAEQSRFTYTSSLKLSPTIQLTAPRAVPWTESWILDASPIWHCDLDGIAVIHHQDRGGQWQPQWRPWPGETVTIKVHRPKAMTGQVLTIQRAGLTLNPGRRFSRGELALTINTSRGGRQTVELPTNANLQEVAVNGKSLPVRQDGQWVTVPLQPGVQTIHIKWHALTPFRALLKAPAINVGQSAVNAKVTIKMPQKRWILMVGGPQWGPAVLFWSYLAVIILAALGLGRLSLTPLKTWHWALLGLGLTQIPVPTALVIVGWLLALGLREKRTMPSHWLGFNVLQIGLILLTLMALIALFASVKAGLIGQPDMQIEGNNSNSWALHWDQDRIGEILPRPWVLSLPIWWYRGMMLVWSLWLAYALLGWLKWGWRCYVMNGAWKKMPPRKKKTARPVPQQPKTHP